MNVLLEGASGTGKNHALGTLVDYCAAHDMKCFGLALESGWSSTPGYWTDRGLAVPECLHWHQFPIVDQGLKPLIEQAHTIGSIAADALYKMPRSKGNLQYEKLISVMTDFPCDRTGLKWGAVHTWGTDRVLIIDGLTVLSGLAMQLVMGNKPTRDQSEWGRAQDLIEGLLRSLCDGCRCHFVLLAHVERELDEIQGGTKIMTSTLGKKLPPKLPAMFSDVILAERRGTKWTWNTASMQADVKTRHLAVAPDLDPDFAPILERWRSRGGRFIP